MLAGDDAAGAPRIHVTSAEDLDRLAAIMEHEHVQSR
jgi:hypothetical protein